jgi:hypothetical protein
VLIPKKKKRARAYGKFTDNKLEMQESNEYTFLNSNDGDLSG